MKKLEPLRNLKLTAGRYLLMIFALTMLPMGTWAENYGLTVAGVAVTSDNASNVLGDEIVSVSYNNATNTLTLRGAYISRSNITVDEGISALTLHLVGQSCIYPNNDDPAINFANDNPSLTITTSETLPGSLVATILSNVTTPVYSNGLSYNDGIVSVSSLANTELAIFTGKDSYTNTDNGDNSYIYSGGMGFYASYAVGLNNDSKYAQVQTKENETTATMWPSSYDYPQLQKVILQIGACTAADVTVQVKGITEDQGSWVSDGTTYSEPIALSTANADGILEIPLENFSSKNVQLVFSSASSFSFIPITIAFVSYQNYNIAIGGIAVTEKNAANITGNGITGSVSYDNETHTLTLNNATIVPEEEAVGIFYSGSDNLTISLIGSNSINSGSCSPIRGSETPQLIFAKGDNQPCSLRTENTDGRAIDGFSETNFGGLFKLESEETEDDEITYYMTLTSTILSGGSGTSADPLIIATANDLKNFATYIRESVIPNTSFVKLSNDIGENGLDCSTLEFEPIGYGNTYFLGTFDGNNKTIKNLTVNDNDGDCVGFVRILGEGGVIKDLTLDNLTLSGGNSSSNSIGGLVGYLNGGTINNCTVQNSNISCKKDSETTSNNSQNPTVGGIAGQSVAGTITNCTLLNSAVNAETFDTMNSSANANAGGIVGKANSGSISGCQVKGTTTVLASYGEYSATVSAGALFGGLGQAELSGNTYEYTVTTTTKEYDLEKQQLVTNTNTDYYHRGIGGKEDGSTDVDGAVMYTQTVTVPGETPQASVTAEQDTYYSTAMISDALAYLVAPRQTVMLNVTSGEGYVINTFTATNTTTNTGIEAGSEDIEDNLRQYTFTMPDAPVTVAVTAAAAYGVTVAGVEVTELNYTDVLGDRTVSFTLPTQAVEPQTESTPATLTLNGATINGNIVSSLTTDLYIHLLGSNVINAGEESAFVSTVASSAQTLVFTTNATTPGQLLIKTSSNGYKENFYDAFGDGLTLAAASGKRLIAAAPTMTPTEGLYWTDQQFTVSGPSGSTLYYKNNINSEETAYTEPFTLTAGNYSLCAMRKVTVDETEFSLYGEGGAFIVHNKPGFSKGAGTYVGQQNITLTNLPSNLGISSPEAATYPQVWYYLGENVNDSVNISSAEQTIAVSKSTKVTVYILDENSGKVYKSAKVEAEYTILQPVDYHFTDSESGQSYYGNGSTVSNLNFGQENTLPWLMNVPEGLPVTYSSSDEAVATVDAEGHITLTGAGYVKITASNEATSVYAAHEEWVELEIRPSDPQLSLNKGIYYTGTTVTMTPTVGNGTMYYKIGYNGELTAYTGPITLPAGTNEIIPITRCGTEEKHMDSYGNAHQTYFVYDEPQFSVTDGSYNQTLEVAITTNIPAEDTFAAIYYKLNDSKTDSTLYEAGSKISITESTKVSAYIHVRESDDYVSDPVEAHYVIRQNAGLAFTDASDKPAEVAEYTIGVAEEQQLPTLHNENEVTVAYSSSNTDVATVNATTGVVTPVGVGKTTITATSAQTDIYLESNASYMLRVYKNLNHESVTVTIADADLVYDGTAKQPTVTLTDGTAEIGAVCYNKEYTNNTNAGTATVTITAAENLETENFYKGSVSKTFTIQQAALTEVTLSTSSLPYNGESQSVTVTSVKAGELELTANEYSVDGNTATSVGDYTVTVSAKPDGNFTGSATADFSIVNRTLAVGTDVAFADGQTWASYYTTTEDLELPEKVMAYIVTAVSETAATVAPISYVPKNVPVLLENNSTVTTKNTDARGNLLAGTTEAIAVAGLNGTVYGLHGNRFLKVTSGSIPARRAYLVTGTEVVAPAGAPYLNIIFGDATAIDRVKADAGDGDGQWYTLDGRKLQQKPAKKGLYIKNGRKVVINNK